MTPEAKRRIVELLLIHYEGHSREIKAQLMAIVTDFALEHELEELEGLYLFQYILNTELTRRVTTQELIEIEAAVLQRRATVTLTDFAPSGSG